MSPAVLEKFNIGKSLYERGATRLLPLLKAVEGSELITANSAEYKQLAKAIDELQEGVEPTLKNKDGFIVGQEISEKDYFLHIARQRQKNKQ